jgi:hypothetical protein
LQAQQAHRLAVVGLGPHLYLVAHAHERGRHAQPGVLGSKRALDEVVGGQFSSDLGRGLRRALVPHGRATSDDAHLLRVDLPERRSDLFREALGQVIACGIATEVGERQHGERQRGGTRWHPRPDENADQKAKRQQTEREAAAMLERCARGRRLGFDGRIGHGRRSDRRDRVATIHGTRQTRRYGDLDRRIID